MAQTTSESILGVIRQES